MNNKKQILIPIPSYGFDPTEVAIPWKLLSDSGFNVNFATPKANKAQADKIMITGEGLGIFKNFLKAGRDAIRIYNLMLNSEEFNNPIAYNSIQEENFYSLYLPGGHHKAVREYLESEILQNTIPLFFKNKKKVAAICHGVLLLARSKIKESSRSVIYNYKTTSLLKFQELLAYNLTKYRLKDYYLTYPDNTVEDEVIKALKNKSQFQHGRIPIFRDSHRKTKYGFFVIDRNYISARWPGDIYAFTLAYINLLKKKKISHQRF